MSGVEGEADEGKAAHEVADDGRDLVPDQVVHDGEVTAQHDARREQEHVHDRMLEAHVEEQHDRHPHGDDLARDRGGHHCADDAGRDHPVAEHAADEEGEHPRRAVCGIADRTALADNADLGADRIGRLTKAESEDDRHHHGDSEGAGEIAGKDEAPVAEHAAERDARALVDEGERHQRHDAGQKVKAHQVEEAEADREEDAAGQRLAGLHVDGDGEGRREREDRSGHIGTDQRIAGRHEDLRLAGVDHLGHEFGGDYVCHWVFL